MQCRAWKLDCGFFDHFFQLQLVHLCFPPPVHAAVHAAVHACFHPYLVLAARHFIYPLRLTVKDPPAGEGDIGPYEEMVCQKQQLAARDGIGIYGWDVFWRLSLQLVVLIALYSFAEIYWNIEIVSKIS